MIFVGQLLKRNFGKVIEDCEAAIKLDSENVKAYFRASKALLGLHRYPAAIEKIEVISRSGSRTWWEGDAILG